MEEAFEFNGKEINLPTKEFNLDEALKSNQELIKNTIDNKKEFPDIGTSFMVNDKLFKINYINYGKKRLSARCYDKEYTGLPELESTCSIAGKLYKVIFKNESKRRITIQ